MKKSLFWILIISIILIIGSYYVISHFIYVKNVFSVNTDSKQGIYYLTGNKISKLYQKKGDWLSEESMVLSASEKTTISNVSIGSKSDLIFYQETLNNVSQIWKTSFSQNTFELAYSPKTSGLENFSSFRNPIISPNEKKVAFIATHDNIDCLFISNIESGELVNLYSPNYQENLTDLAWSKDSQNIVLIEKTNKYSVNIVDNNNKIQNIMISNDAISKVKTSNNNIYVLREGNGTNGQFTSIDLITTSNLEIKPIIDIYFPEKIKDFNISPDNLFITYISTDILGGNSNLYRIKTNGTNLLRLTDKGSVNEVVFSPDNAWIAYNTDSEINITNYNGTEKEQIFDTKEQINKLIIWRQQ